MLLDFFRGEVDFLTAQYFHVEGTENERDEGACRAHRIIDPELSECGLRAEIIRHDLMAKPRTCAVEDGAYFGELRHFSNDNAEQRHFRLLKDALQKERRYLAQRFRRFLSLQRVKIEMAEEILALLLDHRLKEPGLAAKKIIKRCE